MLNLHPSLHEIFLKFSSQVLQNLYELLFFSSFSKLLGYFLKMLVNIFTEISLNFNKVIRKFHRNVPIAF